MKFRNHPEIPSPAPPPGREREVSVCFVDMRGYTRHTESHPPAEIYRFHDVDFA